MSDPITTGRPRPVLLYGMASAAVAAFLGFAGVSDLMPRAIIAWVALAWAGIGAAWSLYAQSEVTPLEDPRDRDGTALVRAPDALPPGSTTGDHDVRDPRP